jgi:hypothetical protein
MRVRVNGGRKIGPNFGESGGNPLRPFITKISFIIQTGHKVDGYKSIAI